MRAPSGPKSGRARPGLALLLAASASILIAACGGGSDAGGSRLEVYVSAPLHGPSAASGQAIVEGAKLALADAGAEAGGAEIGATYLDDTTGEGRHARWDPVAVAANARRATEDAASIAYVGELESGATRISVPITNLAGLLQVSPASTAADLVADQPGSEGPLYQQSGERTFGRVIPEDTVQARAGAAWARDLGAETVASVSDGSDFGAATAGAFADEAEGLGLSVRRLTASREDASGLNRRLAAAGPDLVYYGGVDDRLFDATIASVDDSLATDAQLGAPPAVTGFGRNLRLTSSAQDPKQLPESGQEFVRAYEREYGHAPDRYAAYGYEAMAVVLDSIDRAVDAGDRGEVRSAFFATDNRDSVLGTYSIDGLGNTTLSAISGYRIRNGRPVFDAALEAP